MSKGKQFTRTRRFGQRFKPGVKRPRREPSQYLIYNEALRGHAGYNRRVGLIVFHLLRRRRGWIHRQVESATISDPIVTVRRVSLDFTLGRTRPVAVDGEGRDIHFIPVTLMKKKPMVNFSVEDETGRAMPVLTFPRNCSVSLSVLVVLGEILARSTEGVDSSELLPMPNDVINDLRGVVEGPAVEDPEEIRQQIENAGSRSLMTPQSRSWREFLVADDEFMKAAYLFSTHFLLAVPLAGKAGMRRIIKYSFEEHGDQPKLELPAPVRWIVQFVARKISGEPPTPPRLRQWQLWLQRGLGWKPMATEIPAPLMGQTARYHLEVEAAEGLQITLAQLWTSKKKDEDGYEIPPQLVSESPTTRQRIHLYSTANEDGFALIAARPRSFTIVRTGLMASIFSLLILLVVAVFATHMVENPGPAVSALLLAPAVLAAYIARPLDQPATNEAVFGLRALATLSGIWPLLAALSLAAGSDCETIAARPGHPVETVCTNWSLERPSLGLLALLAAINCFLLLVYMTRVNRPPEQVRGEVDIDDAAATPRR